MHRTNLNSFWDGMKFEPLLDQNFVGQDVKKNSLAATCNHPEARWLTHFAGRDAKSKDKAREVFLGIRRQTKEFVVRCDACGEWGYVHEAFLMQPDDVMRLKKLAERGFSYAQAMFVRVMFTAMTTPVNVIKHVT